MTYTRPQTNQSRLIIMTMHHSLVARTRQQEISDRCIFHEPNHCEGKEENDDLVSDRVKINNQDEESTRESVVNHQGEGSSQLLR